MNKPDIKPINEALKRHYDSKSLSESQLNQLLSMQTAAVEAPEAADGDEARKQTSLAINTATKSGLSRLFSGFHSYRYAFYATACTLLVCLVVIFSLIDQTTLSQRTIDEIAYNHKKDMPIEIASSSIDDIRQYLNKLSFPIISPSALSQSNWQFLGGRYCSINGKLAAQLKIKNLTDNSIYTLYQASTKAGIEKLGETQLTGMVDGVEVSIWREKGLLLGLASSP